MERSSTQQTVYILHAPTKCCRQFSCLNAMFVDRVCPCLHACLWFRSDDSVCVLSRTLSLAVSLSLQSEYYCRIRVRQCRMCKVQCRKVEGGLHFLFLHATNEHMQCDLASIESYHDKLFLFPSAYICLLNRRYFKCLALCSLFHAIGTQSARH